MNKIIAIRQYGIVEKWVGNINIFTSDNKRKRLDRESYNKKLYITHQSYSSSISNDYFINCIKVNYENN